MNKADGFSLLDVKLIGAETHLITHTDFNGTTDLLRLAGNPPGLLLLGRHCRVMPAVMLASGQRSAAAQQKAQAQ